MLQTIQLTEVELNQAVIDFVRAQGTAVEDNATVEIKVGRKGKGTFATITSGVFDVEDSDEEESPAQMELPLEESKVEVVSEPTTEVPSQEVTEESAAVTEDNLLGL